MERTRYMVGPRLTYGDFLRSIAMVLQPPFLLCSSKAGMEGPRETIVVSEDSSSDVEVRLPLVVLVAIQVLAFFFDSSGTSFRAYYVNKLNPFRTPTSLPLLPTYRSLITSFQRSGNDPPTRCHAHHTETPSSD